MTRSTLSLLLFLYFSVGHAFSASASDPYTEGYLKWDAGDYTGAIEIFLEILNGPDAEQWFDDIALLTGELYVTETLSEDGRSPVFSPDSRHFAWRDLSDGDEKIRVFRVLSSGTEHVIDLDGHSPKFSPDGSTVVFMKTEETDRMAGLQEELREATAARDRSAVMDARAALQYEDAINTSLYRADLNSGDVTSFDMAGLMVRTHNFDSDGTLWFTGADPNNHNRSDIYAISSGDDDPVRITGESGFFDAPLPVPGSSRIIFTSAASSPFPSEPGTDRPSNDSPREVVLYEPGSGEVARWEGQSPVLSADGNRVAFMLANDTNKIYSANLNASEPEAVEMVSTTYPIQHPSLSPDGSKLAYQLREGISWNLHLVHTEDGTDEQLSFDIQHELFPEFMDNNTVLAKMGEARHRRSHLYDVETKEFHRLFHNNTIRTVAMENDWEKSPDGQFVVIVSERDGNTISPEQGVYLVRIGDRVSTEDLIERLEKNLQSEKDLRAHAERIYKPIYDEVRAATEEVNITRLYHYQKSLYDFGSKHMTEPGNQKASEYIYETLKSFGYEPELQWFNPQGDIETANVIARLEGTEHPEVVYILSSHFDSVLRSPGADDNSTGTAVLMEAARVLAENPQPATIIFASLTAEESGLLGAREFVRVAEEEGLEVAGVVNNDMMGWTRHHRLDNTIRFSNYGIRDVQHSGAILFTDLITYDSRYYRFTDAQVFYEAYGDVIGGIGSYPILGNPNYHQPTDRLETINHHLVREVAKSTTATLMNLANTPSKVTGLEVEERSGSRFTVSWNSSPESDITHYLVQYTDTTGSKHTEEVTGTDTTLRRADLSKPISVKAVNNRGMESWDAAVYLE
ncbi:MAG: M20/M25/M40 family metallo-hydrolase [Balneolaceae bacterium]|nr:M20/M25/M40 family metallo-hydrolase [Balneolaceae bacterium]